MGASLAKLGRFDEAVKVYQRSIAAKPDFAETHLNMTLAYAELGRTTDVLKTLRTAIALDMRMKDRPRQAIELQELRGNAEFDARGRQGSESRAAPPRSRDPRPAPRPAARRT